MNINDFKEMALGAFEFVSGSFFRGLFQEKGKQTVEKKPEKKEFTREYVDTKLNNIKYDVCSVICIGLLAYTTTTLLTEIIPQKRIVKGFTANAFMASIAAVAPKERKRLK